MAAIRHALHVEVVADESAWQPNDAVPVAQAQAADALSIYVGQGRRPGAGAPCRRARRGLRDAVRRRQLARAWIGNAASVHLASVHLATAMPLISLSCVIPVTAPADAGAAAAAARCYADDLVTKPFIFRGGCVLAPEAPGLSVELDEAKLAAYRVDGA